MIFHLTPKQIENEKKKCELIKRLVISLRTTESIEWINSNIILDHMKARITSNLKEERRKYVKGARKNTVFYACNPSSVLYGKQMVKIKTDVGLTHFAIEGYEGIMKYNITHLLEHDIIKSSDLDHDNKHQIAMARMRIAATGSAHDPLKNLL